MRAIKLPERLRIDTARDCWQELRTALDAGEDLELDGAPTREVDAAGIQVLVMARHMASTHGQGFALTATSIPLQQSLQTLGLTTDNGFAGIPTTVSDKDSGEIDG